MRNFFNSDSRLMKVLAKLFDIGYLSILFILFCIPIVTIGAALTALYYTTVKVIRHDRGYVFHEFWHAFKLNFFPATKLWIVQAVLFILIAFNISLVNENVTTTSSFMLGAYIVIGVIIYAVSCYAYPVLSRFNMKNMQILRMSLFMIAKHIIFTIPLVIISGAAVFLIVFLIPYLPVVPILVPGLASLAYSYPMEIVLKKSMVQAKKNDDEDGEAVDEWYLE